MAFENFDQNSVNAIAQALGGFAQISARQKQQALQNQRYEQEFALKKQQAGLANRLTEQQIAANDLATQEAAEQKEQEQAKLLGGLATEARGITRTANLLDSLVASGQVSDTQAEAINTLPPQDRGMALMELTGVLKPREPSKPVVVGDALVDPSSGQAIYQAPPDAEDSLAREKFNLDVAKFEETKRQNEVKLASQGRLKLSDLRPYQDKVEKVTTLYDDAQKRIKDSRKLLDKGDPKSAFLALRSIMRLSSNEALNADDINNALSKGLIDSALASYARSWIGQKNLTPEQFEAFSNALDVYESSEADRYDNQIADIANFLPDNIPDDQRQDVLGRANRTKEYREGQANRATIGPIADPAAASPEQRRARIQELMAKAGAGA